MSAREHAYDATRQPLVVGRVASLPIERAIELFSAEEPLEAVRALFAESLMTRNALLVASPSLAAQVDAWIAGDAPRNRKVALKAFSYALRMASRCTPFGLFAGAGAIDAGDECPLELDDRSPRFRTHTRPDMALMRHLTEAVEASELRSDIVYATNECAFVAADRLHVTNLALANRLERLGTAVTEQREVSLRNTKAVQFVRAFCRGGARGADTVAALSETFGAPPAESARLLDRLIDAGVVISELRPSPTGDPIAYLTERLGTLGALDEPLRRAFSAIRRLDATPPYEQRADAYRELETAFSSAVEMATPHALQVDLEAAFRGALPRCVLEDAARLADLALRTGRLVRLDRYRERFIERYEGTERMVPLLELVDSNLGLGVPDEPEYDAGASSARSAAIELAIAQAVRAGAEEVELDAAALDAFFPEREAGEAPCVEVVFELAASSAQAIVGGDYRLIGVAFSDGVAAIAGRFANLFGAPFVERAASIAKLSAGTDSLAAELVYAPTDARAYNLFIRPRLHDCEVRAGIGQLDAGDALSPSDLWVGIENERFFLWSQSRGRRVCVYETHAFATETAAPNLCRFLSLVRRDGRRQPSFDLGAAENATYVPRLRHGRIVIRPRRWQFPRSAFGSGPGDAARELERIRERWSLPRYAYLYDGDNRLLLDLDAPISAHILDDQASGTRVVLCEALPSPSETWLAGSAGHHAVEFVAQAVRVPAAPKQTVTAPILLRERERFGPGSVWTYVKFYLGPASADEFIAANVLTLIRALGGGDAIDRWFFLRYADPAHHLRLRLRASSPQSAGHVLERTIALSGEWLREGKIYRYALDTYDPEYERYGGPQGVALAEAFFTEDSAACAMVIADGIADPGARIELAAAAFDPWLAGSDRANALALEAFARVARRPLEPRDRQSLRRIGAAPHAAASSPLDPLLEGNGAGERLASLTHMHCNRLGLQGEDEARVCALLRSLALARKARAPSPAPSASCR